MKFSLYIAKRYLFAKSSNNAVNVVTKIASLAVVVGSFALFLILSVFSGLRVFTNTFLEASDPDIKITSNKGKRFDFTTTLEEQLKLNPDIVDYSKVLEERTFLRYKDKEHVAFVKGVDKDYEKVIAIDSILDVGQWTLSDYENTAIIGNGIAYKLSIGGLGIDVLQIYVPKPGKGYVMNPSSAFRKVGAQVTGVYRGTEEFENKFVFVDLPLAQELLGLKKDQISGIEIKLQPAINANDFRDQLQVQLGSDFKVQTKAQLNEMFYRVVNSENVLFYLLFTLIVVIALFNISGTIIMLIIDKKHNLKTLYNLGATLKEIRQIFALQGMLLTVIGLVVGLSLGTLVVLVQKHFGLVKITQTLAYPVEFRWVNLLIVGLTILVLGFVASKIASSRISQRFIEQ